MTRRVLVALEAALGDAGAMTLWLRTRNGELHGDRPITWLTGPVRLVEQIALRLEQENRDRGHGRPR